MTTNLLPLSLTHRLEAADAHEASVGLRGLAAQLGDDAGIEIARYGRAVAMACTALKTSLYNRVMGFDVDALDHLDEAIDLYHRRGLPARFDLVPQFVTDELAQALRARGFESRPKPIFSNLMMVREPAELGDALPDAVTIEIVGPELGDLLGDTHATGLTYEPSVATMLGRQLTARVADPDAIGFLARVDGAPAATGLLSLADGIGYFGHASTRPEFRGRGCQTALLRARIAEAARWRCDHVVTFPVPETTSHRNVERCGFVIGHRMEIWMDADVDRE